MTDDGLIILANFLRAHAFIKEEDKSVVSSLCEGLRMDDPTVALGLVNDQLRAQVKREAQATYLLGKYYGILDKLEGFVEKHRADAVFSLGERTPDGYKWNKGSKEEYLLASDAKYLVLVGQVAELKRFIESLKHLHEMTFGRRKSLDQLSNNYRRELEGDRRTTE